MTTDWLLEDVEQMEESMAEEQKRAGWTFWCVVAVALLVIFVLSIGPACWCSSRFGGARGVSTVFRPVTWAAEATKSEAVMNAVQWYSRLVAKESWYWTFGSESPGYAEWVDSYMLRGTIIPVDGTLSW